MTRSDRRAVRALLALVVGALLALLPIGPAAAALPPLVGPFPPPMHVLRAFSAPAQPWDPGNRGVDLAAVSGEAVRSAAAGVVVYAALLAGRGVLSIDDGTDRFSYEPIAAAVPTGASVQRGEIIGYVADQVDTCGPPGSCLHWGVRNALGYLDPMALTGAPVVRLLPIWSGVDPALSAADVSSVVDAASPAAEGPAVAQAPGGSAAPSPAASGSGTGFSTGRRGGGPRRAAAAVTGLGGLAGLTGAAGVSLRRRFRRRPT